MKIKLKGRTVSESIQKLAYKNTEILNEIKSVFKLTFENNLPLYKGSAFVCRVGLTFTT